jgi:murein DD-endopeptidase MepM/ murein hydrolase activator NlpD
MAGTLNPRSNLAGGRVLGAIATRAIVRPRRGVGEVVVRARVLGLVIACVLALVAVPPASGATVDKIDDEIEQVQQRASAAARALDALGAELVVARDELVSIQGRLDDASARLRMLDGQLALAANELAARTGAAAEAAAVAAAAGQALAQLGIELAVQDRLLRDQQALTWIYGSTSPPQMVLELLERSTAPGNLAADLYALQVLVGTQAGVIGRVTALRVKQQAATSVAVIARSTADAAAATAAEAVQLVAGLRDDADVVQRSVVADRDRQQSLLVSLESDTARNAAVLAAVDDELTRLAQERADAVRERAVTSGVCPVDGAVGGRDFSNDWGHPRPGGRSHEGTDIFADRGTPLRAVADGSVKAVRYDDSGIGGRYVSIWTGAGEHWYYAHLESVAGGIAVGVPVSAGQLLGTVGSSGNARGTPPHLHIGWYVNDVAYNPYPTLNERCQ